MRFMDFLPLFAVVLLVLSQFCLIFFVKRMIQRKEAQIEQRLTTIVQQFITAPNPETPSPLALLVDQTALVFASRLVGYVQQILGAARGGERKGENVAALEAAEGALASVNPGLAVLAAMLPKKFKSSLLKNPQFTAALSGMMKKGTASAPLNGNSEE